MQALVGRDAALVDEIHFNSRLKYMLVKLKKGTTREQLEAVQPDFIDLTAAVGRDKMSMAILTAESLTGKAMSQNEQHLNAETSSESDERALPSHASILTFSTRYYRDVS